MKAFDWHRMALDKVPVDFLAEVALRSVYTFVLVFIFLKITGRRGVRQMSLFEVLIILTLGSAAGDVAFYDDVPMLPVLVVFVTLALLYRLIMWLMGKSEKLENLLEGKPIPVIEQGELAWKNLQTENMTNSSFLWSCGSTASNSWDRSGWLFWKPTGKSVSTTMRIETSKPVCLFYLLPITQASLPFRATMNMPAYGVAQFLISAPGINNYVPAAQMQNGRRPAGRKESPDSNYVGFMTSSRQILLCDDSHISWLLSFTRCGACH